MIASYTYDELGNITSIKYPNGRTIEYTYNGFGQLSGIPGVLDPSTPPEYDGGLIKKYKLVNGIVTSLSYDDNGRLKTLLHDLGLDSSQDVKLDLNYDGANNVLKTSLDQLKDNEYDKLNRLKTAYERAFPRATPDSQF